MKIRRPMEKLAFRFVDWSSGLWVFVDEGVQPLVALSKCEQTAVTGHSTSQQLLMLAFTRRKIISSYWFWSIYCYWHNCHLGLDQKNKTILAQADVPFPRSKPIVKCGRLAYQTHVLGIGSMPVTRLSKPHSISQCMLTLCVCGLIPLQYPKNHEVVIY